MNLSDINKLSVDLPGDNKSKIAILSLIDIKMSNEVDKSLSKMDSLKSEINIIKWLIGIGIGVIGAMFSFLVLKLS